MRNYKKYQNFKSWKPDSFGEIKLEEERYFEEEFKLVQNGYQNNKVMIEIGFGNGNFSLWSIKQGYEYFGFEAIPELINTAKDLGLNVFSSENSFEEVLTHNSADYVVAWDVFEHLNNDEIISKLLQCHKVLKSGGKVIARVPSGDSPFSGPLQNGDFTHKSVIGSSFVRQIAMETGFQVEDIRSPVLPLMGMGVKTFLRRGLISILQKIIFFLLSKILMGGEKLVLTQNMMFILKKP